MEKVLIITYYWPPSGGAGVQRWLKFTKHLPAFGFEPIVLSVDPDLASYPQKDFSLQNEISPNLKVFYSKTFELYSVYKFFARKKEIPYGGFANEKKPGLVQKMARAFRSHLLLPDPRKGWNKHAYRKAVTLLQDYGIQTVITTSPPHSTQLIGQKLKKKLGIRWIADLRDPWTDIYYYKSLYHSPLSAAIDKSLERSVLKNADAVITVSKALKDIFASKIKQSNQDKFHVIPNGYDTEDFLETIVTQNKTFTITYTGTLSNDYPTSSFFKAVKGIIDFGSDLKIKLIGKFPEKTVSDIASFQLTQNVEIIGYTPHDKIIGMMQNSDALLLIIPDVKDNEGILTGKLFEYIGSKRPILAIGPVYGNAAEIINQTQTGKMHAYDDVEGIKSTLLSYFDAWKNKSKAINPVQTEQYSRFELTRTLTHILK